MDITLIILNTIFILSLLALPFVPRKGYAKYIWIALFLLNIGIRVFFINESHRSRGVISDLKEDKKQKELRIKKLESEVNQLTITAPKLLPDGRIAASPFVTMASEFSDGINEARKLFNDGEHDKAYQIAKSLSEKNPKFGLSYFLMGTIEIQRGNYQVGDALLLKSIAFGIPKGDESLAYHNLGISALQQKRFYEAINYLEKCLDINPKMSESEKLLKKLKEAKLKN